MVKIYVFAIVDALVSYGFGMFVGWQICKGRSK